MYAFQYIFSAIGHCSIESYIGSYYSVLCKFRFNPVLRWNESWQRKKIKLSIFQESYLLKLVLRWMLQLYSGNHCDDIHVMLCSEDDDIISVLHYCEQSSRLFILSSSIIHLRSAAGVYIVCRKSRRRRRQIVVALLTTFTLRYFFASINLSIYLYVITERRRQ